MKFWQGSAAVLLSLASVGHVCAQPAVAAAGPNIDRFKNDVLHLDVEASLLGQSDECPSDGRLRIYIGSQTSAFTVSKVRVSVDGAATVEKTFDPTESASLSHGGLYRMLCVQASPGKHTLKAEVSVRDPDAEADASPTVLLSTFSFDRSKKVSELVLSADSGFLFFGPDISLQVMERVPGDASTSAGFLSLFGLFGDSNTKYQHGGADDPQLRNAEYLDQTGKTFSAMETLLSLRDNLPNMPLASEFERQLASLSIDYGTLQDAASAYREAFRKDPAHTSKVAVPLRLAHALYQRGDYAQADSELDWARPHVDKKELVRWQALKARVLLAQGKYEDARKLLLETKHDTDYDSYVRYYNLGVALLRTGHPRQGTTVLDRVGRIDSNDTLFIALRDRANLTLGYYFLRNKQGATAIPILQRVSSEGQYATAALLGIGWSWLAEPGRKHEQKEIGDERTVGPPPGTVGAEHPDPGDQNLYQRYHLWPFKRVDVPDDDDVRLRHALAAWADLKTRDPSDPAVQDGFFGVAFALDKLDAHKGAYEYYQRAVDALDLTHAKLQKAREIVSTQHWFDLLSDSDGGAQPGGDWQVQNLPNPDIDQLIYEVIAETGFHNGLQDYRDLRLLRDIMQKTDSRLESVATSGSADSDNAANIRSRIGKLLPELNAAIDAERSRLQSMLEQDLKKQQTRNRELLESAHFALARANDRGHSDYGP